MYQPAPMPYQLGTALVDGEQTALLYSQETYLDLHSLLDDATVREQHIVDHRDPSRSLFQVMQEWPYWRERLPPLLEYLFSSLPEGRVARPFGRERLPVASPSDVSAEIDLHRDQL